MQSLNSRVLDAAMEEPLLARRAPAAAASPATAPAATAEPTSPPQLHAAHLHFRRHFWALLCLLRPYPALSLALLAVGEAVVVAEVGKVAGSFYRIVVDRQPSQLAAAMLHAAGLYAASTALYAAATWVTGALALSWRRRLVRHLHRRYCLHHAFFALRYRGAAAEKPGGQEGGSDLADGPPTALPPDHLEDGPPGEGQRRGSAAAGTGAAAGEAADNPDQRIASDAASLCDNLAAVTKVAAAAPFKLLYYSWLTWGYLGWRGLAAVYAFFWAAALVQRLAVQPVSRLVFAQERREGDLRFAHLRLREYAAEVAQYGAERAELCHLDAALASALANQARLVTWRALLAAATRAVDYSGAMLNYLVVAGAVFAGMAGGNDGGQAAQFVSNASFATLSLIYTVTELLDLSDQLSKLVGLTARVGELLEALPPQADPAGRPANSPPAARHDGRHAMHSAAAAGLATRPSIEGRELQPSRFATLVQPPRPLSCLGGTAVLEVSLHQLGPDLQHEARAIFPDAPPAGQLLACLTFQFAAGGVSLAPDSSAPTLERAAAEMDRMLDAFLRWEGAVRAALAAAGCWSDAVDPRTGMALHGRQGARWSEVAAAHALLNYERRDTGICPVVLHPKHGSSAYPATIFTDAPPAVLAGVLASLADSPAGTPLAPQPSAACGGWGQAGSAPASPGPIMQPVPQPLLSLRDLKLRTPAGRLAVAGLSLELRPGQHLLIAGPNGCGKSSLLKALCSLLPIESGTLRLPPASSPGGGGVMFVPQRPLPAPGAALWQQLCYPSGSSEAADDDASSQNSSSSRASRRGIRLGAWRRLRRQARHLGTVLSPHQEEPGPAAAERPSDGELLQLLQRVGLQYLLDRVGGSFSAAADWGAMLSPGELQRLSFARVLLRRPALAVLDEATSAVSEQATGELYGQLHSAGITCLSVGQDCPHLRRLHPLLLRMGASSGREGGWQLVEARQDP